MRRKPRTEIQYFRVIVTYDDGSESGHKIFSDRKKADQYAMRFGLARVVKSTRIESFFRDKSRWQALPGPSKEPAR